MASKKELFEIVGKATLNGEFYQQVKADPEKAAGTLGIQLSPDQVTFLKSNPPQLTEFFKRIEESFHKPGPQPLSCGTCIVDGH